MRVEGESCEEREMIVMATTEEERVKYSARD